MYKDYDNYRTYENDDLSAGATLKVEHTIIVNETDILNLISQPLEKIQAMRDNNVKKETAAFEKVRQSARDWEKKAAITRQFDRAIEYLQVPEVSHSSNKWVNDRDCYNYDCTSISNMVYKMTYRMYDYTSWRSEKTRRWEVKWSIGTNSPVGHNNCIAEQERSFKDKAEAEKYIQGRIKAYSHLFTEISPPIPKEYEKPFMVHEHLLPGYVTEKMQKAQEAAKTENISRSADKKPSIRKELNSIKAAEKSMPKPTQTKKRDNLEL